MAKGATNVYTCSDRTCGKRMITVDRDEGVTPFMMRCGGENPPGCGRPMYSNFYRRDPWDHEPATHEWFAPTAAELIAYVAPFPVHVRAWTREHVEKGGLLIRRIAPDGQTDSILRS